jgi:hypothetical protein
MFGLGLAKYGGIAVGIILLVVAGYLYFAWSQSRLASLAAELATVQQRAIAIEQQAQVLRDDMERVRVALDDTNRRITGIRARAADNARMVRTSGVTTTRDPVEATARANSTMNDAFRSIEEVTRNAR